MENLEIASTKEECKQKAKSNRILYFDILNILACISVILLHCNGIVHNYSDTAAWKESLVIEVVFFFAVPIFFMLTGANLMGYRQKYDTKTFFKKRLLKVVIPFIFWSAAMIIWKTHTGGLEVTEWSLINVLNIFFVNEEETVYYFMFIIMGIYLTLPILSVLAEDKYRKVLWYAVIAMFITDSLLPVLSEAFEITYNGYLSVLFDGHIIFVLLGYLLSKEELDKKKRYTLYILGIASCILRYIVTYCLSTQEGQTNRLLFNYPQFHAVFLASAVFVFIKNIKWDKLIKSEKVKSILAKIAGCSFGIYLIHKIIMHYEQRLIGISEYSLVWRLGAPIVTYIVSLAIVYILKKIPVLKRIVP